MRHAVLSMTVIAAAVLLAWGAPAHAGPGQTDAYTTISNVARMKYEDSQGTNYDTYTTTSADTTVTVTAGDTITDPGDGNLSGAGDAVTTEYTLYNLGNHTCSFAVSVQNIVYGGGGANWNYYIIDRSGDSIYRNGTTAGTRGLDVTVAEYASCTFAILIVADGAAPDGASWSGTIWVRNSNGTAAYNTEYQSAISVAGGETTYLDGGVGAFSGDAHDSDDYVVTLAAPLVILTKSASLAGGFAEPVPGALITYGCSATNNGGADAENVVIYDTVPANTIFANMSGAGWDLYWSTAAYDGDLTFDYLGAANDTWVSYANAPGDKYGGDSSLVTYIKWESTDISDGADSMATFEVMIK